MDRLGTAKGHRYTILGNIVLALIFGDPEVLKNCVAFGPVGFFFSVVNRAPFREPAVRAGLLPDPLYGFLSLAWASGKARHNADARRKITRHLRSSVPMQRTEYPASPFNTQPVTIVASSEARKA